MRSTTYSGRRDYTYVTQANKEKDIVWRQKILN